jgi:hypothetical protein
MSSQCSVSAIHELLVFPSTIQLAAAFAASAPSS